MCPPTETLLCGGKSIFAPWWISFDNKIAAGRLTSSQNLPLGDFQTGDFNSWSMFNPAACLAALDKWEDQMGRSVPAVCDTFLQILHKPNINLQLEL